MFAACFFLYVELLLLLHLLHAYDVVTHVFDRAIAVIFYTV